MTTRFVNLLLAAEGNDVVPAEVEVDDGRVVAVTAPTESSRGERVDLGGRLVLPGVVDGHVHFDDPGFTQREDFATGTAAAAAGGVTCVVDMPCTSLPPVTSVAALHNKLGVIAPKARVDFMLWGGVSGNAVQERGWRAELERLVMAGVAAVKTYTLSGMDTFKELTIAQLGEVLEETAPLEVPVGVHAEDGALVRRLTASLQEAGRNAPLDYAASRPEEAETLAVAAVVDLCRTTEAPLHIVHLASGRALDLVAAAAGEGLPVTAETCPHFLAHTAADLGRLGSLLKTAPVVKSAADRERLWQGLASGELAFVTTDHAAGVWPEEKRTGSIWSDYGGVPGVELMLPYLYSEGVRRGRLTLERLTEVTAEEPANFFGVGHRKGCIAPGFDADLVVLDPDEKWTVSAERLHNLNRYTPLDGMRLVGRVHATYVRGRCVFRRAGDGAETIGAPGWGRWLRRGV